MAFNAFTWMWFVFGRLKRAANGNVAVTFAFTLPVVVGGAGLGVETSLWYYNSLKLQAVADAAAYAGALEKVAGSDNPTIIAAATQSATSNNFATPGTIEVNTPPLSGPNTAKKAVEVIVKQSLDRYFTAIFNSTPVSEQARAVALITDGAYACNTALNPSASQAVNISGNTSLKQIGCVINTNSIAADAIKLQGSATLQTDCLIAVGGVSLSSTPTMVCKAPITHALPVADPYADLPTPTGGNPCKNVNGNKTSQTLQPGTYCSGMSLNGNVTLSPGVYVVQGSMKVNANAVVAGSGVTIFMAGSNTVSMNGNAKVTLSAPTSGAYSGVLFYGDRTGTAAQSTFNGTADSLLTGAIYFPRQQVNYLGNFSGNGGCTQVVADTIQWSGSTTIKQDCTSLGMKKILAALSVQLVE